MLQCSGAFRGLCRGLRSPRCKPLLRRLGCFVSSYQGSHAFVALARVICPSNTRAAFAGYLAYELLCADDRNRALQSQLSSAEADLRKERLKRQVDRTGRTRAEKQVRELQLRLAQSSTPERQRAPSGAEQGRGASTRSVDPLRELEERGYHPDREHVTMGMDESGRAQRSPTRQLKSARLRRGELLLRHNPPALTGAQGWTPCVLAGVQRTTSLRRRWAGASRRGQTATATTLSGRAASTRRLRRTRWGAP